MKIGIDFGTCYTSVAIMNGNTPVTTCLKDRTGMGTPTLFMFSRESMRELYGEQCKGSEAFLHPDDVIRYMKRTVRENPGNLDAPVMSGGERYLLRDVIKKYLTYIISETVKGAVEFGEFDNTEIEDVTITAPVGISNGQMMASDYNRFLQEMVMDITSLPEDHVHIVREPVAAAISYLYSQDMKAHYSEDQTIMVFDLGGGTLDVTVMRHDVRAMTFEILAKEGDLALGGNDWDTGLADLVMGKVGIPSIEDPEERAEFMEKITRLKAELTTMEKSGILFTYKGEDKACSVTRAEFEEVSSDLIERALEVVDRTFASYEGGADSIDKIVLVGGSCNMPMIAKAISGKYEADVQIYEPSKAISKGAAVFSKLASNQGGTDAVKIIDIVDCTYGFESHYEGKTPRLYNMIFKGARFNDAGMIRVRSESTFVAHRDTQSRVTFRIYESEYRKTGDDNEDNWCDLGNGEKFNGLEVSVQIPPEYIGRARSFSMRPEMIYNSNGILELTVKDLQGNRLAYASKTVTAE